MEHVHYPEKRASGDPGLATSDALTLLHETTGGWLRDIDHVGLLEEDEYDLEARSKSPERGWVRFD